MNWNTKGVRILLVLVLLIGVLAACSGNKDSTGSNGSTSTSSGSQNAPNALGGNDGGQDATKPIRLRMTMWGQQIGNEKSKYYDEVLNEINSKLMADKGFMIEPEIVVIPTDQYATKVNTMMAAEDRLDAVRNPGDLNTLIQQQAAADLTDLIKNHAPNLWAMYPENVWNQVSHDGRIYAIPFLSFPFHHVAIARTDWLESEGLELPRTLPEFENMLRKFKNAGFSRSVPLTGHFSPSMGGPVESFFYPLFSEHPGDFEDADGTIKPKFMDPGYKQFIQMLAKWYDEQLIDDSLFNSNESTESAMMSRDAVGVVINNMWQLQFGPMNAVVTGRPELKLEHIPALDDMKAYPSTGASGDFLVIPSYSENARYMVEYIDWFINDEENYRLVMNGLLGVTYEIEDGMIKVPEAEMDAGVDSFKGKVLSGPYENNLYNLKFNTMYKTEGELPQYTQINQIYGSLDLDKVYLSPVLSLGVSLSDEAKLGAANGNKVIDMYILEMIVGDRSIDEWDAMLEEWRKAGGDLAYKEYSEANQNR